jgi:hypothetical protein
MGPSLEKFTLESKLGEGIANVSIQKAGNHYKSLYSFVIW